MIIQVVGEEIQFSLTVNWSQRAGLAGVGKSFMIVNKC